MKYMLYCFTGGAEHRFGGHLNAAGVLLKIWKHSQSRKISYLISMYPEYVREMEAKQNLLLRACNLLFHGSNLVGAVRFAVLFVRLFVQSVYHQSNRVMRSMCMLTKMKQLISLTLICQVLEQMNMFDTGLYKHALFLARFQVIMVFKIQIPTFLNQSC